MPSPEELLHRMLAGTAPTEADIDHLLEHHLKEGQHHDFKSGQEAQKPDKGKNTLLRWTAGFANAEGGLLILGVDETAEKVDGFSPAIRGPSVDQWASDILIGNLGPFLHTAPRCFTVNHTDGPVLVIATARSPSLTYYFEGKRQVYPLRVGHSTFDMPESLVADILHSRRQHPVIQLSVSEVYGEAHPVDDGKRQALDLRIDFSLENLTLVYPCTVVVGVIGYSYDSEPRQLPSTIREQVDFAEVGDFDAIKWSVRHTKAQSSNGELIDLPPLDVRGARAKHIAIAPYHSRFLSFAVYVLPLGSFPQWHQLDLTIAHAQPGRLSERHQISRMGARPPSVQAS